MNLLGSLACLFYLLQGVTTVGQVHDLGLQALTRNTGGSLGKGKRPECNSCLEHETGDKRQGPFYISQE